MNIWILANPTKSCQLEQKKHFCGFVVDNEEEQLLLVSRLASLDLFLKECIDIYCVLKK